MLTSEDVSALLVKANAVITNSHLVYTSGKHGSAYVNKDAVYPHVGTASMLSGAIADRFHTDFSIQFVIGPTVGGVILSQWTAHHLTAQLGHAVIAVYADKVGDDFVVKRGYDELISGKRGIVVEDVLNTGGSVKKVIRATRLAGATLLGVGALVNRGGITAEQLDIPVLHALLNVQMNAWDEADCPLCKAGVAINTQVGKGREYLAKREAATSRTT